MTTKKFALTRVVTRDVVTDAFQGIRNFFGFRLRGYEIMVNRHLKELLEEMELKYKVDWWRIEVNPLTNGSAIIVIYGEGVQNE